MPMLRDLILLLPGHELEGYPRRLEAPLADDLLAAWLGLWHPLVLHAAQGIPKWQHFERLGSELDGSLLVLPKFIEDQVSEATRKQWGTQNAHLVQVEGHTWRAMQEALLARFDVRQDLPLVSELRDEFAALGYCYLQIQLMTRQLRYTSNLNQLLFSEQTMKGVDAAIAGDRETATRMLQSCFDALGQERDHYYSLDVNLLDLTLLAESTLGKSLSGQLDAALPFSVLASGSLLRQLKEKHPESAAKLAELQMDHRCCIIGGLDMERPHPLMSREALLREIVRGKQAYRDLGFLPPKIFGRMSYGMHAETASLLKRANYTGALLLALSGGSYPQSSQSKLSWESADGVFINALAPPLLDAADSGSFLALGWTVGEALDHQHVPTVLFAHWPDRTCDYYPLLQIISARTPALGRWRLLEEYFVDTDQPYHQERLDPGSFRYNWLASADHPGDLIVRTKAVHQHQARCRALHNLLHLNIQLGQTGLPHPVGDEGASAVQVDQWAPELHRLQELLDSLLDPDVDADQATKEFRRLAGELEQEVLQSLASKLVRSGKGDAAKSPGKLVINPRAAASRWPLALPQDQGFEAGLEWHFANGRVGNSHYSAVDVPGFGFVAAPLVATAPDRTRSVPLADAAGLLRNEYLEVQIDEARGHLRSLHVPARRGNRLSMMVAYRERDGEDAFRYSEMICTSVKMLTSSGMCGLQRAVGRLELDGTKLGNFEIDYEVWRGSRIVEVIVKLTDLRPATDGNPWRSAYTLRLAWPSEAAILRSYQFGTRATWANGRTLAPELIEIDEVDYRTHYLTAGMAFHRRMEVRFLETVIACGSHSSVTHRFGIGVDLPSPLVAARSFMDEPHHVDLPGISAAATGWLINVDVREVIVDLESPLYDADGKLIGMRLSVGETTGKSVTAKLRFWRSVTAAARVDQFGGSLSKLATEDDRVTIALRANEYVYVDVKW